MGVAYPTKLQQHVGGGDDADGDKRSAPTEGGGDPARQHGADGAADAIGYRDETCAQAAPVGQEVGHDGVKRRRREAVADAGDGEEQKEQQRIAADAGAAKSRQRAGSNR